MNEFHCLDIEFPNVDFSPYTINNKREISQVHHAHLYTSQDEIELRIFYDDNCYFGKILDTWISKIDPNKFGSFIKVAITKNHTNKYLQKIDLSEAKFLGITNSTNFYEDNKKYVVVKIDYVKFYWNHSEKKLNTAEFYLDDKGHRVVEPFYGIFKPKNSFKNDGKFEINRMNDSNKFYKLGKSSFRPEFNFYLKHNKKDRTDTIVKEPKIQFKYKQLIYSL